MEAPRVRCRRPCPAPARSPSASPPPATCSRSSSGPARSTPTRRSTSTSTRAASSATWRRAWTGQIGSGTCSAASTAATCSRWRRGSRSATCSGCRRGSCTGCGSARVLALAAWGVVRLLDALLDRARGAPHVAAAVLFVLNPYVAVYAGRTSITLLAYAALPWLLLAVHRGLRDPRGWRWPALFALVLDLHRRRRQRGVDRVGAPRARAVRAVRALVRRRRAAARSGRSCCAWRRSSCWPTCGGSCRSWCTRGTAWTSCRSPSSPGRSGRRRASPSRCGSWASGRATSAWASAGSCGRTPPHAHALLFHPAVLVASLLVPALALSGFAWTRRWRYGPWFLLLCLAGLLVMVAGFPEGTPLRRALTFTYNHRPAGPVPAHDVQGGAAARARARVPGRRGVRGAVGPRAAAAAAPRRAAALRPRRPRRLAADDRARAGAPARVRRPVVVARRPRATSTGCRGERAMVLPGRCSPTTTGAGRSTRSCRRWRAVRSPSG